MRLSNTHFIVATSLSREQGQQRERVTGVDIQDGRILVEQLWKTSPEIAEQYRNSALREGDVLLGIIRHLKVAIVPKELDGGNMARTTARLRPSGLLSPAYLAGALESPLCQSWLKANYRGGTDMPKVNIEDVVRLPIPLAPLDEQREVVRLISDLDLRRRRAAEQVRRALEEAALLGQAVLAKAFQGELVRQDPSDEPASVLLERIRASRNGEQHGGTSRKKRRRAGA